jgi:peptidoglycan/LPS O-acetylase OafA/YrhL
MQGFSWPRALVPTLLPNQYPALHGLRVIAIIMVVDLHATTALFMLRVTPFTNTSLWFAMDLFFFLSGFLIGSMLLAETDTQRPVNMLRFYLRRTFRIVPAYLIVLTILATAFPLSAAQKSNLWKEYVYLTNYAPPVPGIVVMTWAWSLALEEHFYLAVPLLMLGLRALPTFRWRMVALVTLWLSALALRTWTYLSNGPWDNDRAVHELYVQTHVRFDILIAGIFAACIQRRYGAALADALKRRGPRYALAAPSVLAFAILVFTPTQQDNSIGFKVVCWGTVTSIAYAPLILHLLNYESILTRALSLRAFIYVATFGYGIYLVHLPVLHHIVLPYTFELAVRYGLRWPVIWPLSVTAGMIISLALGYLIHVVIEKPALKLRDILAP